jgi:hypothetical protein
LLQCVRDLVPAFIGEKLLTFQLVTHLIGLRGKVRHAHRTVSFCMHTYRPSTTLVHSRWFFLPIRIAQSESETAVIKTALHGVMADYAQSLDADTNLFPLFLAAVAAQDQNSSQVQSESPSVDETLAWAIQRYVLLLLHRAKIAITSQYFALATVMHTSATDVVAPSGVALPATMMGFVQTLLGHVRASSSSSSSSSPTSSSSTSSSSSRFASVVALHACFSLCATAMSKSFPALHASLAIGCFDAHRPTKVLCMSMLGQLAARKGDDDLHALFDAYMDSFAPFPSRPAVWCSQCANSE